MKKRWSLLPVLALAAALAGCWDSPTGQEGDQKEDVDDGSGKQELAAVASPALPLLAG